MPLLVTWPGEAVARWCSDATAAMIFRYLLRNRCAWAADVIFVVLVIVTICVINNERLAQLPVANHLTDLTSRWFNSDDLPEDEAPEGEASAGEAPATHLLALQELMKPATKLILLWTRWYGNPDGMVSAFGFHDDMFVNCPVSNCRTTTDRRMANFSQALMFHMWPDFNGSDLPAHRWPQQRYIMNYFEPPGDPNSTWPFNEVPPNFFNWTFTFRRDSDVPSNIYGDYHFIPSSMERRMVGQFELEESLDNYYGINITGKKIMVAWFSSHCPTWVKREDFAKELGKYVQVDIYGRCGGDQAKTCAKKDAPGGETCDDILRKDYLFYLAMENSICHDYVTEKFYRALRTDTVPIVFGGSHYSRFAPPHSYINAFDYDSPKELADYLIKLSNNRRLYSHYFQWKRHFKVVYNPVDAWCSLCQKLNDPEQPPKVYEDISKWWYWSRPCDYHYAWALNNTKPNGLKKK